jgi:anti-anti-sigma regulatory factor
MTLLAQPLTSRRRHDPNPFHSELHERDTICVVRVCGALVESASAVFEQVVGHLKGSPGRSVIIDASLLGEIDDGGVQKMHELQERVVNSGGKLVVYAASGDVAKALESSVRQ